MLWRWLGAIPAFAVDFLSEIEDYVVGPAHGPLEPTELIQFYGQGAWDFYRFFF